MFIIANAINIIIKAQDRASKKIKGIGKTFDSLQASASKVSGIVMGAFASMGAALGAVAIEGTKMNSTLEQSKAKWTTLLKSSQKAEKQMAWMMDYAKQTPFDYEGIDATATSLMGMGMSLEEVNKWLPTLGDASAVLGGGAETVEGLGRALGQMNAKGRVSAEEMQQLAERGVNAWQMLADGMGLPQAEVRKLSEEGKILAEDALPHIYEGMQKAFGGGTANLMQSTVGQAMEAGEQFSYLSGVLTSGAYNWFGANVLPMINKGLTFLTETFSGGVLDGFEKLATGSDKAQGALAILAGAMTTLLVPAVISLSTTLIPLIGSMVVAFAPFLAIGTAVGGLAFLLMDNWSTVAPFFQTIFNVIKTAVGGFITAFMTAFQNLKAGLIPIWTAIKNLFNTLKPVIITVGAVVGAVLGTVLTTAMAVFNGIVSAIAPLVEAFVWFADMVANVVGAVVKLLTGDMKGASEAWKKATQSAVKFVEGIWNAFKGFFSGFIGTIVSIFSKFGVDLKQKAIDMWNKVKSAFVDGLNKAKSAVTDGISNMISAVKGWFSTFADAGKGLLSAFTDGIKKGIGKAVDAVKGGMEKIRNFLPFSPAKEGALSDLDKSGKSFFPTFAGGMAKETGAMLSIASKGMSELGSILNTETDSLQLDSFGASLRSTVVHEIRHTGEVTVQGSDGESTKVPVNFVSESIEERVRNLESIFGGTRQAIRAR